MIWQAEQTNCHTRVDASLTEDMATAGNSKLLPLPPETPVTVKPIHSQCFSPAGLESYRCLGSANWTMVCLKKKRTNRFTIHMFPWVLITNTQTLFCLESPQMNSSWAALTFYGSGTSQWFLVFLAKNILHNVESSHHHPLTKSTTTSKPTSLT